MNEKLFSVITVVFNDKDNLIKTLNSVRDQKEILKDEIEYIIVDGASKDGTLDIILNSKEVIDRWISEPDKGLYDAMNKGINLASGKYLIFMNAGDTFADEDTLLKVKKEVEKNNYPDSLYGDALEEDSNGNFLLKKAYSHKYIWYGMFTHHQSMFYKLEIIKRYKIKYYLKYKIAADYAFTYEYLKYAQSIVKLNFPVCIFLQGGISSVAYRKGLSEANLIRREVGGLNDFCIFTIDKVHKLKHFFRYNFGRLYFTLRYKRV